MGDKKAWWLWLGLIGILIAALSSVRIAENSRPRVIINGKTIFVEVASEDEKRARGLSGRSSMPANHGMLFLFPRADIYPFWMKEMKFSLDIVYIDDEKVVEVFENVPFPKDGQEPEVITPVYKADKVLEINQGMVENLEIKVGDRVFLSRR